jgi:hypothetical protein
MSLIERIKKCFPPQYYVWSDKERRPENRVAITSQEGSDLKAWLAKQKELIYEKEPTGLGPDIHRLLQNVEDHTINSLLLQIQNRHITTNQVVTVAQDSVRTAICDLLETGVDPHQQHTDLSLSWLRKFDPQEAAKFTKTIDQLQRRGPCLPAGRLGS